MVIRSPDLDHANAGPGEGHVGRPVGLPLVKAENLAALATIHTPAGATKQLRRSLSALHGAVTAVYGHDLTESAVTQDCQILGQS